MLRARSQRRRLIVRYAGLAIAVVGVLAALVLALGARRERYVPGQRVEGVTSELERGLPAGYPRVEFRDVAREAGIEMTHFPARRSRQLPEDMGSGVAWGDYNNDGYPDLFVVNIAAALTTTPQQRAASPESNRLFRNNGNGTFTDVTGEAGLAHRGIGMAAAWADYDNDGHLDLVVTTYPRLLLYRNRGDGAFEEVSQKAGLTGRERFWAGASWGDYDGDSDLDLYVCAYVAYRYRPEDAARSSRQYEAEVPFTLNPSSYPPEPNALFRNNGDGTFSEVAEMAGVSNPGGRSLAASWCDFDLDGRPDLYVANDVSDNAMFRNLGDGRFEDVSHSAMAADYRGAMGLAVGDFDSDGDFDIFITHWLAQENALLWNLLRTPTAPAGPLRFLDVADLLGLGQIALSAVGWGTFFFDYDNDGQPDLFVVNGSTLEEPGHPERLAPMKNFLFWQKSPSEGFFEVGRVSGAVFGERHVGRGAAFADYDRDGDLDVAVVNFGERPMLLRNEGGNRNNWIRVRPRPKTGGHGAPGARVEVEAGGRRQLQAIGCQPSYLSQDPAEAHFGLGPAGRVDRLRVRFPSGVVRELEDVPVNREIVVEE